jgi:hypothetical protein
MPRRSSAPLSATAYQRAPLAADCLFQGVGYNVRSLLLKIANRHGLRGRIHSGFDLFFAFPGGVASTRLAKKGTAAAQLIPRGA